MLGFGRRKSRGDIPWTPPKGLVTQRQQLIRSVPFVYDKDHRPVIGAESLAGGSHLSLLKGFEAARAALANVGMLGLRAEIIVMVDDSGSMGPEFREQLVQLMLVRSLGFALHVDNCIKVITYGRPDRVLTITPENYLQAPDMLQPTFGGTPMTEAFEAALGLVQHSDKLAMVINITDGGPNNRTSMSNTVIRSSGSPDILKNLAIKSVPYLREIDDLPSYYEIRLDPDNKPVLDANNNLVIDINPSGLRLVDNVDSKALDPRTATDEEFAAALADEIPTYLEVAGRVGLLTGVPGIDRTFF